MTTTVRLGGAADLLAVLPYQLGFHPQDCLVVVSLRGTRMGLVQRLDLPPARYAEEAAVTLLAPLVRDDPGAVLLVGFERDAGAALPLLEAMDAACREVGVPVADRLVVHEQRWRSIDCTDERCCPAAGRPVPAPGEHPAVAEFVGREVCPLPDREALVDRVRGGRPLLARAVGAEAVRWRRDRLACWDADPEELASARAQELLLWARVLRTDDAAPRDLDLDPAELGRVAASLLDVDVRDALVAWICPGTLALDLIDPELLDQMRAVLTRRLPGTGGGTDAEPELHAGTGTDADTAGAIAGQRLEHRLVQLCASLPDEWAVGALTVLASFAWWRGDGALARVALDRALAADPGYRLATLLERMVDLGIRPAPDRP